MATLFVSPKALARVKSELELASQPPKVVKRQLYLHHLRPQPGAESEIELTNQLPEVVKRQLYSRI